MTDGPIEMDGNDSLVVECLLDPDVEDNYPESLIDEEAKIPPDVIELKERDEFELGGYQYRCIRVRHHGKYSIRRLGPAT